MDKKKQLLKLEVYNLRVVQLQGLGEFVIRSASDRMRALRTNGNGACGMHALFGTPKLALAGDYFELYCSRARELASQHLGTSLEELEQRADVQEHVYAIKTNFWDGFVKAHFEDPTDESEIFWECLRVRNQNLAEAAMYTFETQRASDPVFDAAKNETLRASRGFFRRDTQHPYLEELIIRPLAVLMGCIPSNVDVFQLTEAERVALLFGRGDNEFLKEAFYEDGAYRYVRGTQKIPFPNDGPACRYTALFDNRPEFDPLRLPFLIYGDINSGIHTFLMRLQSLMETDTDGVLAAYVADIHSFLDVARRWSNLQCPTKEIPNFASLAWGAYTECVKHSGYFFSVAELAVIAAGAKRNVSIFSSINLDLRYEAGYYGGDGPVVNIKLLGNNQRRVHSHFERLISAELAEELTQKWNAEERERAMVAKRRRLEEVARAELEERERKQAEKRKREDAEQRIEEERKRHHSTTNPITAAEFLMNDTITSLIGA